MDKLAKKLTSVVKKRLKKGEAKLEVFDDGQIVGHIISPEFDDMEHWDRHLLLQKILKEEFPKEQRQRISTLLIYTPEEWNVPI